MLSLLFWAFFASYIVHLLDETLGHLISTTDFAIGTAVGVATVGAFLTVGPTILFPRIMKARR